jgi:hypothetical protein
VCCNAGRSALGADYNVRMDLQQAINLEVRRGFAPARATGAITA